MFSSMLGHKTHTKHLVSISIVAKQLRYIKISRRIKKSMGWFVMLTSFAYVRNG